MLKVRIKKLNSLAKDMFMTGLLKCDRRQCGLPNRRPNSIVIDSVVVAKVLLRLRRPLGLSRPKRILVKP